jgi:16S rRNA (uracil1498-N3)-methyltransferase
MKPRNRIFLDEQISIGKIINIKDKQAHYLINVLRCKIKEKILIINDGEWLAEIIDIRSKSIVLSIEIKTRDLLKQRSIKLYFSPLKRNPNETLIQKCTEIGVNIFQPVAMEHTNISKVNVDRLKLISLEAIEQSDQLTVPNISQTIGFKEFLKQIKNDEIIIACTVQCRNMSIRQIIKKNFNKDISILIGPEGDFSKVELDNIKSHKNIVEASLGENILKGETASIVASALAKDNLSQC